MHFPSLKYLFGLCVLLITAACNKTVTLNHLLKSPSPYEKYVKSLEQTALHKTALGRDWLAAGAPRHTDSLTVTLPYHETGYFSPEKPSALWLRYQVQEGQRIHIGIEAMTQPEATYFIDVFEVNADDDFKSLYYADSLSALNYEVVSSGWHMIRVQPELLRGGPFVFTLNFEPTLAFPVMGRSSKAIGSFFGDPRDGGVRPHKGVDIFAPKGTPVLAAAAGTVGSAMQNKLGGKVVWLNSTQNKFRQYYAHLDSQTVRPGQKVAAGDTLGFVGNTGNARFTPPHLHFSIYRYGRGAVDPYPFLHALLEEAPQQTADASQIGIPARVKAAQANVRPSPTTSSTVTATYPLHTLLSIQGKAGNWYRIYLPNRQQGFIHDSLVEPLEEPLEYVTITEDENIYPELLTEQPGSLSGSWLAGEASVLAVYDSLRYVQMPQGFYGWISR